MARFTRGESGQRPQGAGTNNAVTVGIVKENVDPNEWGRIKVEFPHLPDAQSFWIRQAAPMAGELRGFYTLPEPDDEVLVAFMNGDPAAGVILGAVWNGKDLPPAEAKDGLPGPSKTDTGASWSTEQFTDGTKDLEGNDRRFWRSRSGHLFVFDDSAGKETVQIWDKDHNLSFVLDSVKKLITLANTQGDLHVRTKGHLFLEAGQDIKIKAGQNIKVETGTTTEWKAGTSYKQESGTETSMKAGTNFDIEATANLSAKGVQTTVEGSATLTAKGGMATFKGTSMAELSGGLVKIN